MPKRVLPDASRGHVYHPNQAQVMNHSKGYTAYITCYDVKLAYMAVSHSACGLDNWMGYIPIKQKIPASDRYFLALKNESKNTLAVEFADWLSAELQRYANVYQITCAAE